MARLVEATLLREVDPPSTDKVYLVTILKMSESSFRIICFYGKTTKTNPTSNTKTFTSYPTCLSKYRETVQEKCSKGYVKQGVFTTVDGILRKWKSIGELCHYPDLGVLTALVETPVEVAPEPVVYSTAGDPDFSGLE